MINEGQKRTCISCLDEFRFIPETINHNENFAILKVKFHVQAIASLWRLVNQQYIMKINRSSSILER